jgi:hypothetical protein
VRNFFYEEKTEMTHEEWEACESARSLSYLLTDAFRRGNVSRKRLVQVLLRCVEPFAHTMPPAMLPLLSVVSAWAHGDQSITSEELREALEALRAFYNLVDKNLAPKAAFFAAEAAAVGVGYGVDAAYVDSVVRAARLCVDYLDHCDDALADVIRDEFSFDELRDADEPEVVSCLRQHHPPLLTPRDCQVIESRTRVAVRSQSGHKLWHLYTKERHARGMLAGWDFVDLIPARKGTTSEAQATKWVVDGEW